MQPPCYTQSLHYLKFLSSDVLLPSANLLLTHLPLGNVRLECSGSARICLPLNSCVYKTSRKQAPTPQRLCTSICRLRPQASITLSNGVSPFCTHAERSPLCATLLCQSDSNCLTVFSLSCRAAQFLLVQLLLLSFPSLTPSFAHT